MLKEAKQPNKGDNLNTATAKGYEYYTNGKQNLFRVKFSKEINNSSQYVYDVELFDLDFGEWVPRGFYVAVDHDDAYEKLEEQTSKMFC